MRHHSPASSCTLWGRYKARVMLPCSKSSLNAHSKRPTLRSLIVSRSGDGRPRRQQLPKLQRPRAKPRLLQHQAECLAHGPTHREPLLDGQLLLPITGVAHRHQAIQAHLRATQADHLLVKAVRHQQVHLLAGARHLRQVPRLRVHRCSRWVARLVLSRVRIAAGVAARAASGAGAEGAGVDITGAAAEVQRAEMQRRTNDNEAAAAGTAAAAGEAVAAQPVMHQQSRHVAAGRAGNGPALRMASSRDLVV